MLPLFDIVNCLLKIEKAYDGVNITAPLIRVGSYLKKLLSYCKRSDSSLFQTPLLTWTTVHISHISDRLHDAAAISWSICSDGMFVYLSDGMRRSYGIGSGFRGTVQDMLYAGNAYLNDSYALNRKVKSSAGCARGLKVRFARPVPDTVPSATVSKYPGFLSVSDLKSRNDLSESMSVELPFPLDPDSLILSDGDLFYLLTLERGVAPEFRHDFYHLTKAETQWSIIPAPARVSYPFLLLQPFIIEDHKVRTLDVPVIIPCTLERPDRRFFEKPVASIPMELYKHGVFAITGRYLYVFPSTGLHNPIYEGGKMYLCYSLPVWREMPKRFSSSSPTSFTSSASSSPASSSSSASNYHNPHLQHTSLVPSPHLPAYRFCKRRKVKRLHGNRIPQALCYDRLLNCFWGFDGKLGQVLLYANSSAVSYYSASDKYVEGQTSHPPSADSVFLSELDLMDSSRSRSPRETCTAIISYLIILFTSNISHEVFGERISLSQSDSPASLKNHSRGPKTALLRVIADFFTHLLDLLRQKCEMRLTNNCYLVLCALKILHFLLSNCRPYPYSLRSGGEKMNSRLEYLTSIFTSVSLLIFDPPVFKEIVSCKDKSLPDSILQMSCLCYADLTGYLYKPLDERMAHIITVFQKLKETPTSDGMTRERLATLCSCLCKWILANNNLNHLLLDTVDDVLGTADDVDMKESGAINIEIVSPSADGGEGIDGADEVMEEAVDISSPPVVQRDSSGVMVKLLHTLLQYLYDSALHTFGEAVKRTREMEDDPVCRGKKINFVTDPLLVSAEMKLLNALQRQLLQRQGKYIVQIQEYVIEMLEKVTRILRAAVYFAMQFEQRMERLLNSYEAEAALLAFFARLEVLLSQFFVTHPSISLNTHPSISLNTHPSISLNIHPSISLNIHPSIFYFFLSHYFPFSVQRGFVRGGAHSTLFCRVLFSECASRTCSATCDTSSLRYSRNSIVRHRKRSLAQWPCSTRRCGCHHCLSGCTRGEGKVTSRASWWRSCFQYRSRGGIRRL